jgi:glutamyl-tRNA reductase
VVELTVVVVGLNHRTAPLHLLEAVAVPAATLAKALSDLSGREHLSEVAIVSTCLRTEIYALATRFHGALSDLRTFLADWSGRPPEYFAGSAYSYHDEAAVEHLFRVAAGVDSVVVGEGEILQQVREAWASAREERTVGPFLDVLFRHAVEAGKRARTETAIARGTVSVAQAALSMSEDRLGGLAGRNGLVVGAGTIGEALAKAFAVVRGHGQLLVANRTWLRASELAGACGGLAVAWGRWPVALEEVDVLFTATGSPGLLLGAAELEAVLAARAGRPLLIVDLAVPRDIDPSVRDLPGITLLDIDDLKHFAESNLAGRRQEIPKVEQLLAEEVARHLSWAEERNAAPIIAELRARAETVRQGELARFQSRLASLDERERDAVEALTKGLIGKLLHEPTLRLKSGMASHSEDLSVATRRLFGL